jgi:hypothetical protein
MNGARKNRPAGRTTFRHGDLRRALLQAASSKTSKSGLNPFQLLGSALDLMVDTGVIPKERRHGAEYLAWSAVHGLAFLIIEGPLRRVSETEIHSTSERVLQMAEKGC